MYAKGVSAWKSELEDVLQERDSTNVEASGSVEAIQKTTDFARAAREALFGQAHQNLW